MSSPRPANASQDSPGYLVKFETYQVGNDSYHIRSLLDRQQYSDPDGEAEQLGISSATWPLFGMMWPSGLELAKQVEEMPLAGKRILEIGCGLALASLVAHRRGADITASDIHPLAETFLLENIALNQMRPLPYAHEDWAGPDSELGGFDLIIGSDLLYERDQPGCLSRFIDAHSAPKVEIIIIDPDRGHRARFNREMAGYGYSHRETRLQSAATLAIPAYKGRTLNYTRDTTSKLSPRHSTT